MSVRNLSSINIKKDLGEILNNVYKLQWNFIYSITNFIIVPYKKINIEHYRSIKDMLRVFWDINK